MKVRKIIMGISIILALVCWPVSGFGGDGWQADLQDSLISGILNIDQHYSSAEFDALSDDQKLDVFYNHPDRLPADFQADKYQEILHPDLGEE